MAAIITPLVVDTTVFFEATRNRIGVLGPFGGQVCSDWFGYVDSHRILPRAIAQTEVSHHTDDIGSTH